MKAANSISVVHLHSLLYIILAPNDSVCIQLCEWEREREKRHTNKQNMENMYVIYKSMTKSRQWMANMCSISLKDVVTSGEECKCEYLLIMPLFTRHYTMSMVWRVTEYDDDDAKNGDSAMWNALGQRLVKALLIRQHNYSPTVNRCPNHFMQTKLFNEQLEKIAPKKKMERRR